MPVVNIGLERSRDLAIGSGDKNAPVNSIGFGTNDAAEDPADTALGAGVDPKDESFWKTGVDVTITTGGDGTIDPWWQMEATWAQGEANFTLFEIGTSAGGLTGQNPVGEDGTKLFSRKRIGGATGIGKTLDIELIGRVRMTY